MSLSNKQKNTHNGVPMADGKARLNRIPNKENWEDTLAMGEVKRPAQNHIVICLLNHLSYFRGPTSNRNTHVHLSLTFGNLLKHQPEVFLCSSAKMNFKTTSICKKKQTNPNYSILLLWFW